MSSSTRRAMLLAELETKAKALDAIEGMIVVGSGAHGFTDDLSDLDVVLVVDPTDKLQQVVERMAHQIEVDHHPLALSKYRHHAEVHVLCYLFEDMLELDLGIWSLSRLFASKPDWTIQYSKSSRIEEKLRETSRSLPTPDQTAENLLQSMWIQARAAVVAVRRKQVFKAQAEINAIRSSIVQLVCESHGITYDFERKIEMIDDPLVSRLGHSFATGADAHDFLNALKDVCNVGLEAIAQRGINVSDAGVYLQRLLDYSE